MVSPPVVLRWQKRNRAWYLFDGKAQTGADFIGATSPPPKGRPWRFWAFCRKDGYAVEVSAGTVQAVRRAAEREIIKQSADLFGTDHVIFEVLPTW